MWQNDPMGPCLQVTLQSKASSTVADPKEKHCLPHLEKSLEAFVASPARDARCHLPSLCFGKLMHATFPDLLYTDAV